MVENVNRITRLLPVGTSLKLVDDYSSPIIPRDCAVEQLALYQDAPNRLLVVEEIWSKLDKVGKAALIVHEALYRQLRFQGETSSDRTRLMVGLAFSGLQFDWIYEALPSDFLLCATDEENPQTRLAAFIENGAVTLQFFQINGVIPLAKNTSILRTETSPFSDPSTVGSSVTVGQFSSPIYEGWHFQFHVASNATRTALDMVFGAATMAGKSGKMAPLKCHATQRPTWNLN